MARCEVEQSAMGPYDEVTELLRVRRTMLDETFTLIAKRINDDVEDAVYRATETKLFIDVHMRVASHISVEILRYIVASLNINNPV
jgi:hypothetical protein